MIHFRNRACAKGLVSMTLSNGLPFVLIPIRDGANTSTQSGRVAEQIRDVLFSGGNTPVDPIVAMHGATADWRRARYRVPERFSWNQTRRSA